MEKRGPKCVIGGGMIIWWLAEGFVMEVLYRVV